MKKLLLAAAAATFSVAFVAPANADHLEDNLIRQSHRVESIAGTLQNEFREHFRHTAEFGHLMSDAYALNRRADSIHGLVHHIHSERDVHRAEAAIKALDRQVHHLADLVEEATHGHGGGHVDGDIRHVFGYLAQLTNAVHSMESTIEALEARFHRPVHPVHPGHGDHDHGHGGHHEDIRATIIRGVLDRVINGGGHAGHGH